MNIIEARERTRVGGRYRRKGFAWSIKRGSTRWGDRGDEYPNDIIVGIEHGLADDWAPDPGCEEKCPCFFCQRERGEQTGEEGPAICMENPDPINRPFMPPPSLEAEWKADIACKMAELTKRVMRLEAREKPNTGGPTAMAVRQAEIVREHIERLLNEHEDRLNHLYDPTILELRSKIKDAVELFKTRRDFDNSKTAAHAERITQLESQNVELHARVTHIEAMVGLIPNTKAYCPACHEHIGLAGCKCWRDALTVLRECDAILEARNVRARIKHILDGRPL